VKLRTVSALAAGVGLWFGGMAAAENKNAKVSNQSLANTVATTLEKSGNLHGKTVDITVTDGIVELKGKVTDGAQHDAVISTVLTIPGVKSVIDSMSTSALLPVRPVQALESPTLAPPPAGAGVLPAPTAGPIVDPLPLGGGATPYDLSPPRLPPYAWPTYAPYNNVSRVAYPNNYPSNAFPFIGPFYPFPKVPLGWRSVTLEWQDGHWWMGRNGTKYDYWRVRYW
jgi:hypothetical protein